MEQKRCCTGFALIFIILDLLLSQNMAFVVPQPYPYDPLAHLLSRRCWREGVVAALMFDMGDPMIFLIVVVAWVVCYRR